MASSGIYVDANLQVLLVAGLTERGLISKHRRLREYTVDDYDLLGPGRAMPPCDPGRRKTAFSPARCRGTWASADGTWRTHRCRRGDPGL